MSQFLENAQEIFEAAENSAAAGHSSSQYTILVGSAESRGGIHMIADSYFPLDTLKRTYGAQLAYRVSQVDGRVVVDGCDGQHICHMEAVTVATTAKFLLNSAPAWHAEPSYSALLET